jgi:hypothetical protein
MGIFVDVDTRKAKFKETPLYLVSLSGWGWHAAAEGISAIYPSPIYPPAKGFRVYLRYSGDFDLTPDFAKSQNWAVQWVGIPWEKINKGFRIFTEDYSGSHIPLPNFWDIWAARAISQDGFDEIPQGDKGNQLPQYDIGKWRKGHEPLLLISGGLKGKRAPQFRQIEIKYRKSEFGLNSIRMQRIPPFKDVLYGITDPSDWKGQNILLTDVIIDRILDNNNQLIGRFFKTPLFFTSLKGDGYHWDAKGITSIFNSSPEGFRINLSSFSGGALTPEAAKDHGWALQWIGIQPGGVVGSTPPGNTPWETWEWGIKVRVDTSSGHFKRVPYYFTSLWGDKGHDTVNGVSSIYDAKTDEFTIYLVSTTGQTLTPELANENGWAVQWIGIEKGIAGKGGIRTGIAGSTKPTDWQEYRVDDQLMGIFVDVDTRKAKFKETPLYLVSLSGWGWHAAAEGISAIYPSPIYPPAKGFRVYLRYSGDFDLTPDFAKSQNWAVQWVGIPRSL